MRRVAFCFCMALLLGCARSENRSGPLAQFAGTWRVRGTNEAGDSIVSFVLTAARDTAGWTLELPNRPPIPLRVVAVAGDSVVTEAGPYESVLRPGVQVRTQAVVRLQGDRLVGTTVARYSTTGPDSVLRVRTEGTRMP
jgi:hypothetical protein